MKKKSIRLAVLLLLLGISSGALFFFFKNMLNQSNPAVNLEDTKHLIQIHNFDQAKKNLLEIIRQDPSNEEALRLYIFIAESEENYFLASQLYRRLSAINPFDKQLPVKQAMMSNNNMDFASVITLFYSGFEKKKLAPEAYVELAIAAALQPNDVLCLRLREDNTFMTLPETDDRIRLAHALISKDKAQQLNLLQQLQFTNDKALRFLSLLMGARIQPEKAEEYYRYCYKLHPILGANVLGTWLFQQGRFEDVVTLLKGVPLEDRTLFLQIIGAESALVGNHIPVLTEIAENITPMNQEFAAARNYVESLEAYSAGDYEKLSKTLPGSIGYESRGLYRLMNLAVTAKNAQSADEIINQLLQLPPVNKQQLEMILQSTLPAMTEFYRTGKVRNAVELANTLYTFAPQSDLVIDMILIGSLELDISSATALKLAKQYYESGYYQPHALMLLISNELRNNNANEAEIILKKLRPSDVRQDYINLIEAAIAELRNQPELVIKALRKNLESPDSDVQTTAMSNLSAFYFRNANLAEAQTFAAELLNSDNPTHQARGHLLNALIAIGKSDDTQAAADLDVAIRLDPKLSSAFLERAKLFQKAQAFDLAIQTLERGLDASPENPQLLMELARYYAFKNENREAETIYKSLLKQYPDDVLLLMNYAEVAQALDHREQALDAVKTAATLAPNSAIVRSTYGKWLLEDQKYFLARNEFLAILKKSVDAQEQKTFRQYICDTYVGEIRACIKSGRLNEAEKLLKEFQEFAPGITILQDLKTEILARTEGKPQ